MNEMKMRMGGGTDIAQLAEMIRRMGRGDDKILAHITPEEAAMLKEQGGSGEINPMTGLPEFVPSADNDYRAQILASEPPDYSGGQPYYGTTQTGFNQAVEAAEQFFPGQMTQRQQYDLPQVSGDNLLGGFEYTGGQDLSRVYSNFSPEYTPGGKFVGMTRLPTDYPAETMRLQEYAQGLRTPQEVQPSILDRAESGLQQVRSTLDRYPTLTRVGGAGANLVAQALLARRANRAREAEAGRLRERAQPFRAAEQEAMSRAQGGGLTPQQAREMEIAQARARQGLSAGNRAAGSAASGILAGQATRARSAARQESLESALELAGIADRYERQAIQEELAGDKELAQLFASVIGKEIEAASRTQAPEGEK
jgi:hypothetical protein